MQTAEKVIFKVDKIRKAFALSNVLHEVSIEVSAGTCMLLIGANGCGKSTLLRICAGLMRSDSGSASFENKINKEDQVNKIGFLGHDLLLYGHLSVEENIDLMRKLRRINVDTKNILSEWNLSEHKVKKISELSRGLQFRTALAAALVHSPKYLFLDEPTSSLDQHTIELLKNKIKSLCLEGQGFAVIATHDIHRLADSANRIAVLNEGKIAADSGDILAPQLENKKSKVIEYYNQCNR